MPTHTVVFGVICKLWSTINKSYPLYDQFTRWYKKNNLYKIKTKPITREQITAQDETEVETWYRDYKGELKEYKIQWKNIHNFDETGFRVGCPRGIKVIVPIDIKEVRFPPILSFYILSNIIQLYQISPEVQKSVIIIEEIPANGSKSIPLTIVI